MGIVEVADLHGKKEALDYFDQLMEHEINKPTNGSENSPIYYVSYLCGALFPYGIVSEKESDALSDKYSKLVIEKELNLFTLKKQ